MSDMVRFKLNPEAGDEQIEAINAKLAATRLKRAYKFITRHANQEWVDDINNNPKSPQSHLGPITMEELQQTFDTWAEVGLLEVDIAFERASPSDCKKIAAVLANEPLLAEVSGLMARFIEKISDEDAVKRFRSIYKAPEEPEEPALNEDRRDPPQSGVASFLDWNGNEICVLYGNVNAPRFMKDDRYQDDRYNGLYRDKLNRPYLLVPLLKLGASALDDVNMYWQRATDIGLRCHPAAFGVTLYSMNLASMPHDELTEHECLQMARAVLNSMLPHHQHQGTSAKFKDGVAKPCVASGNDAAQFRAMAIILTMLARHHGYSEDKIARLAGILMEDGDIESQVAELKRTTSKVKMKS